MMQSLNETARAWEKFLSTVKCPGIFNKISLDITYEEVQSGRVPNIIIMVQVPDRTDSGLTWIVDYSPMPVNVPTDEFMRYCIRRRIHKIVLHEADEQLTFDGVRAFDPHINDHSL